MTKSEMINTIALLEDEVALLTRALKDINEMEIYGVYNGIELVNYPVLARCCARRARKALYDLFELRRSR